jgi:hypothetical protein
MLVFFLKDSDGVNRRPLSYRAIYFSSVRKNSKKLPIQKSWKHKFSFHPSKTNHRAGGPKKYDRIKYMGDPSGMLRKTIKNTKLNYSKMNNNLLKIFKQWRSSGN